MKCCEICGKPLVKNQRRFCSYACRNVWRNKIWTTGEAPITLTCPQCGSEFKTYKSQIKRNKIASFCSRQCKDMWQRKGLKGKDNPNWHGGDIKVQCKFCGRELYLPQSQIKETGNFCSQDCLARWKGTSDGFKRKVGEATRFRLNDADFLRKWLLSLSIKPNKLETYLDNILQHNFPRQWEYVGDGQLIIGGKWPDFANINGKKQLIELFGDYWHQGEDPQDKIDHYKKYGFKCLVIWEHELNQLPEEQIVSKVREFVGQIGG